MKVVKRILIGLLGLILIAVIGLVIYLQTTKPVYDGEIIIPGLTQAVEVYYDRFGVPHIYAKTSEDAYFALGYVHAQDRLFQMEMLRRAAGGRLSEILGADLIPVDKLFRTLGLNRFAEQQARKYLTTDTADFQKAAFAYQKGINHFVHSGKTPVEFSIIGIPKQEFTPKDIYLAIGFMSFGFAEGLRVDPVLQKIKTELGDEYLKSFAVETPLDAVRIPVIDGAVKGVSQSLITSISQALGRLPIPLWQGSNGWVISGDRTASGLPILENDTHIGFSQPAVWYEAHLEYPGHSFYGHHLAGLPFGILGNNRRCGWGLTMFENDDTDFYIETLNPANANQVKFKGEWEELTSRQEIIKVKGQSDVLFEVKASRHGYLVNGILENTPASPPVSLSWTITQLPNEDLQACWLLNHASSLAEAQRAAALFTAPGLNLMYGDVDGNIAWWAAAKLPIRPAHVRSKFFLDGASGNDEILGYYDFSKNPHSINPPSGFVFSANNQPDSTAGVLYPGYYYPKSRAGRIAQLVGAQKKWTPEDVQQTDLDVVSVTAPEVAGEMVAVLTSLNRPDFEPIVKILAAWNGDHKTGDVGPSVYYNMLSQVMSLAMVDEIGQEAYHSIMGSAIPKNSFLLFIKNENSPWWDDVQTKDKKETRSDIMTQAATNALNNLRHTSGTSSSNWTWAKIHTLTHAHPLAAVKPLDRFFNVGPFPVDGGMEVINNLSFELQTSGYFPVNAGPALRKVTDFGDVEHGTTISPTGQSGNVMSPFYQDQAKMFATGKSRPSLMNRTEIEADSKNKLILKP